MSNSKLKILAIGAHVDDCWLGLGATALKAVRSGHSVTFVTAVGDYQKLWYLAGREQEVKAFHEQQSKETGIQYFSLKHNYMRLENNPALVDEMAQIILKYEPDILFIHDENESNQDHAALGAACRIAALHAECFVPHDRQPVKLPGEIYQYSTGWQSRGYAPDTFVNVNETVFDMLRYSSSYDVLYANGRWPTKQLEVTDPAFGKTIELTSHSRFKFGQCITVGGMAGGYNEAFKSYRNVHVHNRRLASI